MNLMTIGYESPKAGKGQSIGFITAVLYLAPDKLSGVLNVCPMAEVAGCQKACLNTAGFGSFDRVQQARINRTRYFFERENDFMNDIAIDINRLVNKAKNKNLIPLIRLNGTSDILWEKKRLIVNEKTAVKINVELKEYKSLMEVFPNVQFYDYTKITGRKTPPNYDLTFSYSGVEKYQSHVKRAITDGMRIAVVFRDKNRIPTEFLGMKVLSGDNTDVRHLDPKNVVISLYAKGKAKTDASGFVVDVSDMVAK